MNVQWAWDEALRFWPRLLVALRDGDRRRISKVIRNQLLTVYIFFFQETRVLLSLEAVC